jgi:hypothetical protein
MLSEPATERCPPEINTPVAKRDDPNWAIAASDVPAPKLANRVDEHFPSMIVPLIALRRSCKVVGLKTLNIVPTRN